MARAKNNEKVDLLEMVKLVMVVVWLPFVVLLIAYWVKYRRIAAFSENGLRVTDWHRAFSAAGGGFAAFSSVPIAAYFVASGLNSFNTSHGMGWNPDWILGAVILPFGCILLFLGERVAKSIAIGLVGAGLDPESRRIHFPSSPVVRGPGNALAWMGPSELLIRNVDDIHAMNRERSISLILHFPNGSQKITFSDKLMRDELMAGIRRVHRDDADHELKILDTDYE